nr:MAG TPA: DNA packaging protein [Caudoviricetes sp.]
MALELFGEDFKNELFQDLVKLNVEALKEAKRQVSRQISMVPIKEVMQATGWGRKRIEDFRDQGKFSYQQNVKGGKYLYDLNDVLRFQSQLAKRG